jgi:hypothetical protein
MIPSTITRAKWAKLWTHCHWCGRRLGKSATHEIIGGPNRPKALKEPACWLRLCDGFGDRNCHEQVQGLPKATQLALKYLGDPTHYNLSTVVKMQFPKCQLSYIEEVRDKVCDEITRLSHGRPFLGDKLK